ncbi:MAG: carboxypeptidase-like regulatory domain-containing protein [Paludibaculum sp.]
MAQSAPSTLARSVRITGQVVDATDGPLARTLVSLTPAGSDAAKFAMADNDGSFAFDRVTPGAYLLKCELQGFLSRRVLLDKPLTEQDVNVGRVVLEVGEITEGPLIPDQTRTVVKPMTVCESLANRKKLAGKPVAIVGRIECGASFIDHNCFLVEDRCVRPVTSDGGVWPNQVYLLDYWEEGTPRPPSSWPKFDESVLAQKLSLIGRSTTLGMHREPSFKMDGSGLMYAGSAEVKDEWGIAYGTFFSAPRLQKPGCEDEVGCGGFIGAPAALITLPHGLLSITSDGKVAER